MCTRTWRSATTTTGNCCLQRITFSRSQLGLGCPFCLVTCSWSLNCEIKTWLRGVNLSCQSVSFFFSFRRKQMFKLLHLQASQIDRTDVSLWFSLAGVAAKLGHLHMCRGALEVQFSIHFWFFPFCCKYNTFYNRRASPVLPTTGHAWKT